MKFALALLIAVHFWGERNVHVPCHPVAVSDADAQLPLDQRGFPFPMAATSGCQILISHEGGFLRLDGPEWYCAEIVHEVGHLAGLPHSTSGIMAPRLYGDAIPYDCEHWKATTSKIGLGPEAARRVKR